MNKQRSLVKAGGLFIFLLLFAGCSSTPSIAPTPPTSLAQSQNARVGVESVQQAAPNGNCQQVGKTGSDVVPNYAMNPQYVNCCSQGDPTCGNPPPPPQPPDTMQPPDPFPPSEPIIGNSVNVAMHPGGPVQGMGCNNSMSVGDQLGMENGQEVSVANVNIVAQGMGLPVNASGQLLEQTLPVGWVYKDNLGGYWIQTNPAYVTQWSVSINLLFGSFGITPSTAPAAHYVGTAPPQMKKGEGYGRCFSATSRFANS